MKESLRSVSDVMRSGVVSVSRSTSLHSVARTMHEHAVHGVLVVADDGELLGWVTARGLLRHPAAQWRHLDAGRAVDEPCMSVVPTATLRAAIDTMLAGEVTHLAVVRPGSRTPDGVLSELDLVAAQAR